MVLLGLFWEEFRSLGLDGVASEVSLTLAGPGNSLEMACRTGVKNRFGGRGQAGRGPVGIL